MTLEKHQRGVALLTILLMVVIASVLATTMIAKQQRYIKETSIMLRQDNAYAAALAGEKTAIALLKKDAKTNKTDSKKDVWAKPVPKIKIPQGHIQFKIIDLSGRYNINNLHHSGQADLEQRAFFERLLTQLGLSSSLVEAVIDWQDQDSDTTGANGAEEDYYAAMQIQPADQDFQSIDELRLVKGFTPNAIQALRPYIVAVPRYTKININTAKMPIFTALAKDLNSESILKWLEQRKNARAFEQITQLFSASPFTGLNSEQKNAIAPLLAVESQLFLVQTEVMFDGRKSHLNSYLFKHKGDVIAYQRDFSNMKSTAFAPKNVTKEP